MQVDYLANHQHAISRIAQWFYGEWAHLFPGRTIHDFLKLVEDRANIDKIPFSIVALESGVVIGTASLKMYDMDDHLELAPWLAGLYVDEQWRGRGAGTMLVEAVEREASDMGFSEIFLYTPDSAHFYSRLGWRILELTTYNGTQVALMCKTLASRGYAS